MVEANIGVCVTLPTINRSQFNVNKHNCENLCVCVCVCMCVCTGEPHCVYHESESEDSPTADLMFVTFPGCQLSTAASDFAGH